jgi:hypothetical protein
MILSIKILTEASIDIKEITTGIKIFLNRLQPVLFRNYMMALQKFHLAPMRDLILQKK